MKNKREKDAPGTVVPFVGPREVEAIARVQEHPAIIMEAGQASERVFKSACALVNAYTSWPTHECSGRHCQLCADVARLRDAVTAFESFLARFSTEANTID